MMKKIIIRIEDDIAEGEALLMVHHVLHSETKDNTKNYVKNCDNSKNLILSRKNSENSRTFRIYKEDEKE